MLMGEYAVLHGHTALVAAIDKRITIELTPHSSSDVAIESHLGERKFPLSNLTIHAPFQFVLATFQKFKKKLTSGCKIKITSEFSDQVGFASSAAVTVALIAVLDQWLGLNLSPMDILKYGRKIIRSVQGLGSGADIAASVFGGVIAYKARPLTVEKLAFSYPLTVVYSGYKTPTPVVVRKVEERFFQVPHLYKLICSTIGAISLSAKEAILYKDWKLLGKLMDIQQSLMKTLGVTTPQLESIVYTLTMQPNILGVKISGSGLGDCLIGLGPVESQYFSNNKISEIPVGITNHGVKCE